MFELTWPWFLCLLPVPVLFHFLPTVARKDQSIWFPNAQYLQNHEEKRPSKHAIRLPLIFLLLAWICLVVGIARPVWRGAPTQVIPSGRDIMIALDLSGSMQVKDMKLNNQPVDRLTAEKWVLSNFIKKRRGDRIGLIVFGTKAYLEAPFSFDTKTINQLVQETQIGFAGQQTAIGDAIGLAIQRMENKPDDKKVLILMTDGANTAGQVNPEQAADFAASQHLKIYTIGIGADRMVVQGFFGPQTINPSSDLDEKLLKSIAHKTGGQFFRARNTQDLKRIYADINKLEPTKAQPIWQRPITSYFHWLGLASLVFFALTLLTSGKLSLSRFKSSMRKRP
ncbi:von Willebrand factor type A domain protein [Marinomonas spartinae]|uniref:von Willebrand factor type A domain protein n=1 Tax=Marinomonas spartinae TaxID=1792290 RepID=A0A1A8TE64_9GAMM|nr:VWA domain-containing protein [Marinomonas spartinae]SBS30347.1 von Willebrand factor type A domain protein [Marinomonas spartinae]